MSYFNLKRIARLLTFLLAFLPISDVVAASVNSVTIISDFEKNDTADAIAPILQAAGIPQNLQSSNVSASTANALAGTLSQAFANSRTNNRFNPQTKLVGAVQAYNSSAQAGQSSGSTVAAVKAAMQNLVTLMAVAFLNITPQGSKTLVQGMTLPLTSSPILADNDQDTINNYIQELAAWIPYYQAVTSGSIANLNNIMLQDAANQLGLVPATAQQMQQLINNSTNLTSLYGTTGSSCSTNLTIQKQINCAIAWYTNQLNILTTNTANITAATTALGAEAGSNGAVDAAKDKISGPAPTGAVANYGSQITSATTTSAVVQAYNSGVSAINAAYAALIGNSGVIATQNNAFTAAKAAGDAALAALVAASPSANLTAAQTAYNAAVTAFTTDYNSATTDFPTTLPATLDYPTANSTTAFQNSVPGAAIINLYNDQNTNSQSPAKVITNASSNVTALNTAVTALITVFSNDQTTGTANINAATTVADANAAFNNALAKINQDYTNQVLAGTYSNALNSAITLETALSAMTSMNPVPTGLTGPTGALTIQTNAVNAAKAQFPEASSGPAIQFSVANSTGSGPYASSVIGKAITALNTTLTTQLATLQNPASSAQTTAATNLTNALSTATSTITTAQTTGLTAINAATAATVKSVLQAQITGINTAYLTVVAAGGAYLTAYNAANNMASNATTVIPALTTAISNANTALPIIANPGTATFTVANSTGTGQYAATIPGQAVAALQNAANLFDPVALTNNLNTAVTNLTNAMTADQTAGTTNINTAGTDGAATQFSNALIAINADYIKQLNSNNVATLLAAAGKITAPSAALTTAIAAANKAYPVTANPGTAPFTVANTVGSSATHYNSVPGAAINALASLAKVTNGSGGGGGLSRLDIGLIIAAACIVAAITGIALTKWKQKNASPQDDPKAQQVAEDLANSSATDEQLQTMSEEDPTTPEAAAAYDDFFEAFPGINQDLADMVTAANNLDPNSPGLEAGDILPAGPAVSTPGGERGVIGNSVEVGDAIQALQQAAYTQENVRSALGAARAQNTSDLANNGAGQGVPSVVDNMNLIGDNATFFDFNDDSAIQTSLKIKTVRAAQAEFGDSYQSHLTDYYQAVKDYIQNAPSTSSVDTEIQSLNNDLKSVGGNFSDPADVLTAISEPNFPGESAVDKLLTFKQVIADNPTFEPADMADIITAANAVETQSAAKTAADDAAPELGISAAETPGLEQVVEELVTGKSANFPSMSATDAVNTVKQVLGADNPQSSYTANDRLVMGGDAGLNAIPGTPNAPNTLIDKVVAQGNIVAGENPLPKPAAGLSDPNFRFVVQQGVTALAQGEIEPGQFQLSDVFATGQTLVIGQGQNLAGMNAINGVAGQTQADMQNALSNSLTNKTLSSADLLTELKTLKEAMKNANLTEDQLAEMQAQLEAGKAAGLESGDPTDQTGFDGL